MRISVGAGTYVVAVSGGVDSMVLLDLLQQRPGVKLVVAHFDHGIREDSNKDKQLVQDIAKKHGLAFVHKAGKLGPDASEAKAREARYRFLQEVKNASGAQAIIAAHHQDDALETAVINLLRGSGRLGLTSLKSTDGIIRPLLGYTKQQIYDYAANHSLSWREDESNTDTKYLRNHVRVNILPKFSDGERAQLIILLDKLREINDDIDNNLTGLLHVQSALNTLDRTWFIGLPHDVSKEVVHTWLRRHGVKNVNKKTIERVIVAMKTGRIGGKVDIDDTHQLRISKTELALKHRER